MVFWATRKRLHGQLGSSALFSNRTAWQHKWKTRLTHQLFFATHEPHEFNVFEDRCVRLRTLAPLWRMLAWSFRALASGVHPGTGPDGEPLRGARAALAGTPICGGASCALVELRGDWSWHKQCFAMKAYWGAKQVCHRCQATVATYSDFRLQHELRDVANFLEEVIDDTDRPHVGLLDMPGFHPSMIRACTLHTINLGIAQACHVSNFV